MRLSIAEARRFHRRAVLLDTPVANVGAAIAYHGFIQIDPINVCGRMHDLILRNRVSGYHEGDLFRYLHGPEGKPLAVGNRVAFEHHLPDRGVLVAMPLDAWPYLLAGMRHRSRSNGSWSGELDARQIPLAERILKEIATRGALSSEDVDDDQRQHQGWGPQASLAKVTLHKLFYHGRLVITRRQGQRRLYDLPERVLPRSVLESPEPSDEAIARWLVLLKLRQRRLVKLSKRELGSVNELVQAIEVDSCPPLFCLKTDLPLLEAGPVDSKPILLAPLDPLIYDRPVTSCLWNFDYTWEVYTPPAKRMRGYYALPVLAGTEIVGHIDPKADRQGKRLKVMNRSIRRGHSASAAVRSLATFLGLK
jgi:uncharacterized protein YcaQ